MNAPEICPVCGGRPSACAILGHRPEKDRRYDWRSGSILRAQPVGEVIEIDGTSGETLLTIRATMPIAECGRLLFSKLYTHPAPDTQSVAKVDDDEWLRAGELLESAVGAIEDPKGKGGGAIEYLDLLRDELVRLETGAAAHAPATAEDWRVANGLAFHATMQRIGSMLDLPAGADLTKEIEPALRRLLVASQAPAPASEDAPVVLPKLPVPSLFVEIERPGGPPGNQGFHHGQQMHDYATAAVLADRQSHAQPSTREASKAAAVVRRTAHPAVLSDEAVDAILAYFGVEALDGKAES